jgi:hypothetical protein
VRLEEKDGGTLLIYDARLQVGGKLAQLGSRLVLGATRKMADDFFGSFSRELDPAARRIVAPGQVATQGRVPAARIWLLCGIAIAALLIWWFVIR